MGTMWTVPWTGTVTNAGGNTDLWEILPAAEKPILLRMIRLGQTSEVADAAEEGLRVSVIRMTATVTSGSGGSADAPEALGDAAQAPSFAGETNNTTVATTTGDTEILDEIAWINRISPLETWYPDERFCPRAENGEALLIRLQDTVADDITFAGSIFLEEL